MSLYEHMENSICDALFFALCCTQLRVKLQQYRNMKHVQNKSFLDYKFHIILRGFRIEIIFEETANVFSFPEKRRKRHYQESNSEQCHRTVQRPQVETARPPWHRLRIRLLRYKLTHWRVNQTWRPMATFCKRIGNLVISFSYKIFLLKIDFYFLVVFTFYRYLLWLYHTITILWTENP